MGPEYVKISTSENFYAQRNLLHTQLEVLDTVRRIRSFKLIRGEDLLLRGMLKSKLKEATEAAESLNKILPASHFKEEPKIEKKEDKKKRKQEKETVTLEDEIQAVKEKIAALQAQM